MSTQAKRHILHALWRDKLHVEPTALELSPPSVRDRLAHIWQPAELLRTDLEAFPVGLLRVWQESECGHLVFTHRPSVYQPGPQPWRTAMLESVGYLSLTDLLQDRGAAMRVMLNLLDHLLGSGARADGAWLSDGAGLTPALQAVGERFQQLCALGYGHAALGARSAHDYFAHTLWLYLSEPQRLNILDPLTHKLYHHTLMAESFWDQPARSATRS